MAVLKNVNIMWADTKEVNDMTDKYQVDCTHLTDEQIAQLEKDGLEIKECDKEGDKNRGKYITARSNYPIRVVDNAKRELDVNLGNGTIANVAYNAYPWTFKGKKGVGMGCQALQVLKLVEAPSGLDEFEEEPDFDGDDEIPF